MVVQLQKLQTFVCLARVRNYTLAAEELFMTQSNVSKHIQSLEKEWQVKLFERKGRKLALTASAQQILPLVEKIVLDYDELLNELTKQQQQKKLRLYSIPTLTYYPFFKTISSFKVLHPEIELDIKEATNDQLFQALDQGKCDLILVRCFADKPNFKADYNYLLVEKDPFVVALPAGHRLVKKEKLSFEDLKNEDFIQLDVLEQLNAFQESCKKAGFTPQIKYKGKQLSVLLDLVKNHFGISIIMSKPLESLEDQQFVTRPLIQPLNSKLYLVRKKVTENSVIDEFWQYLAD